MGQGWTRQVAESNGGGLGECGLLLVDPLLRGLGVQRRTCARHGSQHNSESCAVDFSGKSDAFAPHADLIG